MATDNQWRTCARMETVDAQGKEAVVELRELEDFVFLKVGYSDSILTTSQAIELADRLVAVSRLISQRREEAGEQQGNV